MNVQVPRPTPRPVYGLRKLRPPERPMLWSFAFLVPTFMSAVSWLSDGVPEITDFSFVTLTTLCVVLLIVELRRIQSTFCFGGVLLLGGYLTWFCYDYMTTWFMADFATTEFQPDVVAKAAFFHTLFMWCALTGLKANGARWLENSILKIPSPSRDVYIVLILITFAVGVIPFFAFSRLPWYEAIYRSVTILRSADAREIWTLTRTGVMSGSWGSYITVFFQIGEVGGLFAAFYAIIIPGGGPSKFVAWFVWAFWLALAFGTGARGQVIYLILPVALLFIIRQELRPTLLTARPRTNARWLIPLGAMFAGAIVLVQLQGYFRNVRSEERDIEKVSFVKLQGNTMFSEGLFAWALIPDSHEYFANTVTGEGALRAMPDTISNFAIGPIPRVLWPDKPRDTVGEWLSKQGVEERATYLNGFTITPGLVTYWYIRYGPVGVIEGGLLFGWLASVVERALSRARRHPMGLMLCLSLFTWLFRSFRDFSFITLYPLMIGSVFIYLCVKFFELSPEAATAE